MEFAVLLAHNIFHFILGMMVEYTLHPVEKVWGWFKGKT